MHARRKQNELNWDRNRCRAVVVDTDQDAYLFMTLLLLAVALYCYLALTVHPPRPLANVKASLFSAVLRALPGELRMPSAAEVRALAQERFLTRKIAAFNSKVDAPRLAKLIVAAAAESGLDPLALAALIRHESNFVSTALSSRGAVGLMQILPETAEFISRLHGLEWSGAEQLEDPAYNLKLGINYLKHLLEMFKGNYRLAFQAYNWGPGKVKEVLSNRREANADVERYAQNLRETSRQLRREFAL